VLRSYLEESLEDNESVQRCCARHDTLEEVTRHLIRDFSRLDVRTVAREVARAVAAVRWVGLVEGDLLIVELIARVQLELQSGEREDIARLDPQPHPGRRVAMRQGATAVGEAYAAAGCGR
jgi:hypothetical protein